MKINNNVKPIELLEDFGAALRSVLAGGGGHDNLGPKALGCVFNARVVCCYHDAIHAFNLLGCLPCALDQASGLPVNAAQLRQ